ncbi:MAG: TRAP transporter small permease [Motiliproteus sp.]
MSFVSNLNRYQLKAQEVILVVASVFIVVGVSSMAIMRYVFESNLYGAEEVVLIFAFWLYFLGAGYAGYKRQHISAEVFSVYCSSQILKKAVKLLAETITVGLSILYTYWGVEFLIWSATEGGTTPVWRIPLVVVHLPIFIGFFLITIYAASDFLQALSSIISGSPKVSSHSHSKIR